MSMNGRSDSVREAFKFCYKRALNKPSLSLPNSALVIKQASVTLKMKQVCRESFQSPTEKNINKFAEPWSPKLKICKNKGCLGNFNMSLLCIYIMILFLNYMTTCYYFSQDPCLSRHTRWAMLINSCLGIQYLFCFLSMWPLIHLLYIIQTCFQDRIIYFFLALPSITACWSL